MILSDKDLQHLEQIKEEVASTFKTIDGVVHVFWHPLWNMNDVGRRWVIAVNTITNLEPIDRSACYDGEAKLYKIFPDVSWDFEIIRDKYPSFENMNWNMNNAGFVILD